MNIKGNRWARWAVLTASLLAASPALADQFTITCDMAHMDASNYPSVELGREIHPQKSRFEVDGSTVRTSSFRFSSINEYFGERIQEPSVGTVTPNGRRFEMNFEINTPEGRFGFRHTYIPHTSVYVQEVRNPSGQVIGSSRGECIQS